ncbi:MAG: hypothetical protein LBK61_02765, partial [Spirochaetaceae bacterium]|nr:hypothetical protein [Spirochaetaceae bacterium]
RETYPRFWPRISGVPLRGRKPYGFSSLRETYPDSCRKSAAGRQSTPLWRLCFPFGRAMPPQGGALPAGDDAG